MRWVLPGDLASVEEDGEVVLHGRGSTSINTGGEKVFPEEVESALLEHRRSATSSWSGCRTSAGVIGWWRWRR